MSLTKYAKKFIVDFCGYPRMPENWREWDDLLVSLHLAFIAPIYVVLLLGLGAFLLVGCQQQTQFSLERVPATYRSCAVEVMPALAKRSITQKELILAYAELKRYAGTQNRCLRGLIGWADAQHSAYYRHYN